MNVYEAIEKSPIGVAWHEEQQVIARNADNDFVKYNPYGWQPLYVSPWEYQLGEPLAEAVEGRRYISIRKGDYAIKQGQWTCSGVLPKQHWTYYADPRPLPKLPEPKEEPKKEPVLFDQMNSDCFCLTDEGRRRLERLLRKEGK